MKLPTNFQLNLPPPLSMLPPKFPHPKFHPNLHIVYPWSNTCPKDFKTKLEEILIKSKLVIESDECFSIIIIEVHPSNFVIFVIIIIVKICENSTLNNINYWAINFDAHFRLQYS